MSLVCRFSLLTSSLSLPPLPSSLPPFLHSLPPELASTSDQNPTSSIGAVGVISCSIISCGQVSIVFDIDTDIATQISLNTTADVDETLGTVETTSEATITTLGRVNEGMSQSCNVTYGGVVLREEIFNYTLESE